jgi:hypothetical protein
VNVISEGREMLGEQAFEALWWFYLMQVASSCVIMYHSNMQCSKVFYKGCATKWLINLCSTCPRCPSL